MKAQGRGARKAAAETAPEAPGEAAIRNLHCAIVRAFCAGAISVGVGGAVGSCGAGAVRAGGLGVGVGVGGRNRRRATEDGPEQAERRQRRRELALRATLVVALLAVAGGASVFTWRSLERKQAFAIRAVRFEGLSRASAAELLALSPVRAGDHLLSADPAAVRRALLHHPWVKDARVRRSWPPALSVRVTERRAVALVELSGLYLVDDEAEVFKRAAAGDGLDLPLVTGLGRDVWLRRRGEAQPLLSGALALARAWSSSGMEAEAPLSEIHLEPGEGTTIYVGAEGTEVRLGSGDLEAKLSRLKRMLSALRAEGKQAEVLHLDNRLHPTWVTARLAGGASP